MKAVGIGAAQTSIYVVMSRTYQAGQLQPWLDLTPAMRRLSGRRNAKAPAVALVGAGLFRRFHAAPCSPCHLGGRGLLAPGAGHGAAADYFAIEVTDATSGRGIPLVEFETVNHIRFVSDSQGYVAINDPDLLDHNVFFTVRALGYDVPGDAQGFTGQAVLLKAGLVAKLRLKRVNIAERMYRLTGSGIYRDSVMLERPVPIEEPLLNGSVAGQDSMLAIRFRDHVFWFGGDTLG